MPGNGWAAADERRSCLMAHRRHWCFSHAGLGLGLGLEEDGPRHHDCWRQKQQQIDEEDKEEEEEEEQRHCRHGVVDKNAGVGFGRRSSFPYHRLPEQQLRLTILKLDGSSFDVHVMRSASVSELRVAVEEVFTRSPTKDEANISWSHVWGHFCLCYNDHKLIDDKTCLRTLGIKDGDQLRFIRHLSINYNPVKQRSRKNLDVYEEQKIDLTGPRGNHVSETEKDEIHSGDYSSLFVDKNYEDDDEYGDLIPHSEFKLARLLREWLLYSGLWCSGRTRLGARVRPTRLDSHCPEVGKG